MRRYLGLGIIAIALVAGFYFLSQISAFNSFEEYSIYWAEDVDFLDSTRCLECHQETYLMWNSSIHERVSCETCHEKGKEHIEMNLRLPEVSTEDCERCHENKYFIPPSMAEVDINICATCHDIDIKAASYDFSRIDFDNHYNPIKCFTCHETHNPEIDPKYPPQITHLLQNRSDCKLCHGLGASDVFPESHINRPNNVCTDCHSIGAGEKTLIPPQLYSGDWMCLSCHSEEGSDPLSEDHPEILIYLTECNLCHSEEGSDPLSEDHPEMAVDLDDCLLCHGLEGLTPLKSEHIEREGDTCLICHTSDYASASITPVITNLVISMPEEIFEDSVIPYYVKLRDLEDNPVSHAIIEFHAYTISGRQFLGYAITNTTGSSTFSIKVEDEGSFTVEAVFRGNELYSGSRNSTDIITLPSTTQKESQDSVWLSIDYSQIIIISIISVLAVYGYAMFQLTRLSTKKRENSHSS